uniref:Uncharacterized protein n=1 Tax=Ditylenchus dipsaci TaxID=166011 RepID=A0A915DK53_9BILA
MTSPPPTFDPNARVVASGPTNAHLVWQTNQQTAGYYDKFACRWTPVGAQVYQEQQFPHIILVMWKLLEDSNCLQPLNTL